MYIEGVLFRVIRLGTPRLYKLQGYHQVHFASICVQLYRVLVRRVRLRPLRFFFESGRASPLGAEVDYNRVPLSLINNKIMYTPKPL